jgi:hypothetical protein
MYYLNRPYIEILKEVKENSSNLEYIKELLKNAVLSSYNGEKSNNFLSLFKDRAFDFSNSDILLDLLHSRIMSSEILDLLDKYYNEELHLLLSNDNFIQKFINGNKKNSLLFFDILEYGIDKDLINVTIADIINVNDYYSSIIDFNKNRTLLRLLKELKTNEYDDVFQDILESNLSLDGSSDIVDLLFDKFGDKLDFYVREGNSFVNYIIISDDDKYLEILESNPIEKVLVFNNIIENIIYSPRRNKLTDLIELNEKLISNNPTILAETLKKVINQSSEIDAILYIVQHDKLELSDSDISLLIRKLITNFKYTGLDSMNAKALKDIVNSRSDIKHYFNHMPKELITDLLIDLKKDSRSELVNYIILNSQSFRQVISHKSYNHNEDININFYIEDIISTKFDLLKKITQEQDDRIKYNLVLDYKSYQNILDNWNINNTQKDIR